MARQREGGGSMIFLFDGAERFLGLAFPGRQAESPVFDLESTSKPIVREAEDDRAGQPAPSGQFNLPREELTLARFAFAERVHAEFAEDQWLGVGEHLQ